MYQFVGEHEKSGVHCLAQHLRPVKDMNLKKRRSGNVTILYLTSNISSKVAGVAIVLTVDSVTWHIRGVITRDLV